MADLKPIAKEIRRDIVKSIGKAASGHPGGSLSAVEILTLLYYEKMNVDPGDPKKADRDRFVLSRGTRRRCFMPRWPKGASSPKKSSII